jgi:transposase
VPTRRSLVHARRVIVNATLYVNRTGCAWRYLPRTSRPGAQSTATSPPDAKTASCSGFTTVTQPGPHRCEPRSAPDCGRQQFPVRQAADTVPKVSRGLGQRLCRQTHRLDGHLKIRPEIVRKRDAQAFEVLAQAQGRGARPGLKHGPSPLCPRLRTTAESHEAMVLWTMIALMTQEPPPDQLHGH